MYNTKIELAENLVDYLYQQESELIYRSLRNKNHTPLEILRYDDWSIRKDWLAEPEAFYDLDTSIEDILEDWMYDVDTTISIEGVERGSEQVVIIFEDEVYKICYYDLGSMVNDFIEKLEDKKLQDLFVRYNFKECYKELFIYSQERVCGQHVTGIETAPHFHFNSFDEYLSIAVSNQLNDYDLCNKLNNILEDNYAVDIHNGNWGTNELNQIKIFDPLVCD